jgi:hypothetical protein
MFERLTAAVSAILVAAGAVIGIRDGTEEPPFVVVERFGEIEIRRYGPRLAAETSVSADPTTARGEGFTRLARYIFGGNSGGDKIAMTAPVVQAPGERIAMTAPVARTGGDGVSTIRFFMPADRTRASLPVPTDSVVSIVEVAAATMAVLRFSGGSAPPAVAAQRAALLAALASSRWRVAGEVEDWFFDPPWTLPALRRNEVAVAVTPPAD